MHRRVWHLIAAGEYLALDEGVLGQLPDRDAPEGQRSAAARQRDAKGLGGRGRYQHDAPAGDMAAHHGLGAAPAAHQPGKRVDGAAHVTDVAELDDLDIAIRLEQHRGVEPVGELWVGDPSDLGAAGQQVDRQAPVALRPAERSGIRGGRQDIAQTASVMLVP